MQKFFNGNWNTLQYKIFKKHLWWGYNKVRYRLGQNKLYDFNNYFLFLFTVLWIRLDAIWIFMQSKNSPKKWILLSQKSRPYLQFYNEQCSLLNGYDNKRIYRIQEQFIRYSFTHLSVLFGAVYRPNIFIKLVFKSPLGGFLCSSYGYTLREDQMLSIPMIWQKSKISGSQEIFRTSCDRGCSGILSGTTGVHSLLQHGIVLTIGWDLR